jgi:DNA-binding LacI/PurR family transcriptional regulator
MGFDGLLIGDYTVPTLTTIRQSVEDLAGKSISILLENIESPQMPRYETVPVTIVSRESAIELS